MLQNCCRILFFYCRSAPFLQLNAPRKFRLLCKDSPSITGMAHSPYQSYLHDILSVIFDNRTSTKLKSTYNLLDYTIEYMQQAFSTNITLAKLARFSRHESFLLFSAIQTENEEGSNRVFNRSAHESGEAAIAAAKRENTRHCSRCRI